MRNQFESQILQSTRSKQKYQQQYSRRATAAVSRHSGSRSFVASPPAHSKTFDEERLHNVEQELLDKAAKQKAEKLAAEKEKKELE